MVRFTHFTPFRIFQRSIACSKMPTSSLSSQAIHLRVYHDFERPRNGLQVTVPYSSSIINADQLMSSLHPVADLTRYTPYIYSSSADCLIPLSSSPDISLDSLPDAPPHQLDIKLVSKTPSVVDNVAERLVCDSGATSLTASWFGIGIVRGKTAGNHGTLWRTALQLGASMTFTIGKRYNKKIEGSADIFKTYRQVPCLAYENVAAFMNNRPVDTQIVVIEYGGEDLITFQHPKRAIYILGSEDSGVPPALVQGAQKHVSIPTAQGRPASLNVAAAGAVVMYDRFVKETLKKQETGELEVGDERLPPQDT